MTQNANLAQNISSATPRFERLLREHRIDLDSGAWNHDANIRVAQCGRCGQYVGPGDGRAYNEFMTDGYRASTRYLCGDCSLVLGGIT